MTRRRLVGLSQTATDHEGHVAEGVGEGECGRAWYISSSVATLPSVAGYKDLLVHS
jgi:hypothetical protein